MLELITQKDQDFLQNIENLDEKNIFKNLLIKKSVK